MIKFEEHDGLLFKMLDKPVPLTPDAEMPCLVRFRMPFSERFRRKHEGVAFFCDAIKKNPLYGNRLYAYETRRVGCIAEPRELEIIGTLVKEGSKEWALYQMMQGKWVYNPFLEKHKSDKLDTRCLHAYSKFGQDVVVKNILTGVDSILGAANISHWTNYAEPTGWQIYEEPKEEPLLADAKIGWRVLFSNNESRTIEDIVTHKNLPKRYVMNEAIVQQLVGGSSAVTAAFNEDGTAYTHFCGATPEFDIHATYAYDPKATDPKPAPTFKVGDWVEHKESKEQATIRRIMSYGAIEIEFAYSTESDIYQANDFHNDFRKLSPSEVVIRIGCLSGTIAKSCDPNYFLMLHSRPATDCNHSLIRFSALDTQTRELVESLLEAQEEE